jgi:hypothetical protein
MIIRPSPVAHALASALVLVLAACRNERHPGSQDRPGVISGVVVDPYVEGAVVQELTVPARRVVQESSATGADGVFTFQAPLTRGNLVALSVKGLHSGAPYTVRLERRVDVDAGVLVVSPLTTLLAAGRSPEEILGALSTALAGSLAASDLTADPMARAVISTDAKGRQLLATSIAVGGALQIVGGNAASPELAGAANVIGARVLDALEAAGDVNAGASAGAAVADWIAKTATPSRIGAAAAAVDPAVIASLVHAAVGGAPVELGRDAAGRVVVTPNPVTVSNHLSRGLAALHAGFRSHASDDYLLATNELAAAVALAGKDATASQNDLDTARFFGGLARLAVLAQPYSDATENGLNDYGDLLDAFGMSADPVDRGTIDPAVAFTCETTVVYVDPSGRSYRNERCRLRPISAASPRSGELQAFLSGQVGAALRQVVENLSGVSATFTARLTDGPRVIDLDHTDALFLKGVAQGMIAAIELQRAYDLDVDLHAEQVRAGSSKFAPGAFLAGNPAFLRLVDAASVQRSRPDALAAIETFIAALGSLRAEPAGEQANDLIRVADETCAWDAAAQRYVCTAVYNPEQALADAMYALTTAKAVAESTGDVTFDRRTADPADDVVVNASRFFAGLDGRAFLPARFDLGPAADRMGAFPDPTFGGVVPRWPAGLNPNTDLDADGLPDLFGGYTRFGPWLEDNYLYGGGLAVELASSGSAFTEYGFDGTYHGTFAYAATTLTLTYTGTGPGGATRRVITATQFRDGGFTAEIAAYADATLVRHAVSTISIWRSVEESARLAALRP